MVMLISRIVVPSMRSNACVAKFSKVQHVGSLEQEVAEANQTGRDFWEIRHTGEKGYGIFALRDISCHEVLFRARCMEESDQRSSHSVQTDWNRHVHMNLPARFINHSCAANVGIKDNYMGAFDFYSLEPICTGEELTWDYGGAEFDSISIAKCLCGAQNCRGNAIGFRTSHEYIRRQYGSFYAKYLHLWKE